jgi:hypothetical protein
MKKSKKIIVVSAISFLILVSPVSALIISNVQTSDIAQTYAVINWNTDQPSNSLADYGTTTAYDKVVFSIPMTADHAVALTGLLPDTMYHFRVVSVDANGVAASSSDAVFITSSDQPMTPPSPLEDPGLVTGPTSPPAADIALGDRTTDADNDGLDDDEERYIWGTDPRNSDTDGDGYMDGTEVTNGYDPYSNSASRQVIFSYSRPRLKSLTQEQAAASSLKILLEQHFGVFKIPVSNKNWHTIVNAYIYGRYTLAEIQDTIENGPQAVHPAIPASAWRKSADYQKYLDRIN